MANRKGKNVTTIGETQKLIISVVIFAVVVVLLCAGVAYFFFRCRNLDEKIAEVKNAVAELDARINQIPALAEKCEVMKREDDEFAAFLPTDQEASIDEFFEDSVFEYGKKTGVRILSAKRVTALAAPRPGLEERGIANVEPVTYDLSLKAGFFAFGKFLSLLESHKRFIRIDSFSIVGASPDSQGLADNAVNYDISLQVTTYVFKGSK